MEVTVLINVLKLVFTLPKKKKKVMLFFPSQLKFPVWKKQFTMANWKSHWRGARVVNFWLVAYIVELSSLVIFLKV